jgi:hypothetical protein
MPSEREWAMMKILAAAALTVAMATPGSAQSVKHKQNTAGTYATQEQKARATGHSPSGNPKWDVYVRGEYVGSDPDPRVRATLRQEATRNYGFR